MKPLKSKWKVMGGPWIDLASKLCFSNHEQPMFVMNLCSGASLCPSLVINSSLCKLKSRFVFDADWNSRSYRKKRNMGPGHTATLVWNRPFLLPDLKNVIRDTHLGSFSKGFLSSYNQLERGMDPLRLMCLPPLAGYWPGFLPPKVLLCIWKEDNRLLGFCYCSLLTLWKGEILMSLNGRSCLGAGAGGGVEMYLLAGQLAIPAQTLKQINVHMNSNDPSMS